MPRKLSRQSGDQHLEESLRRLQELTADFPSMAEFLPLVRLPCICFRGINAVAVPAVAVLGRSASPNWGYLADLVFRDYGIKESERAREKKC